MTDFLMISDQQGWQTFARKFDCVVDPMTARTAELFLNGRTGCQAAGLEEEQTWAAIDKNIGGLLTFFNLLVSRKGLPLIQYGDTFHYPEMDQPGARDSIFTLLDRVDDGITANVFVDRAIYLKVKNAAIGRLIDLDIGSNEAISDEDARDVGHELAAFRYDWKPDIPQLPRLDPQRMAIAQFLLGGLIFGTYAEASDADHILQSKRSRVFAGLTRPGSRDKMTRYEREEELFAELKAQCLQPGSNVLGGEMPSQPSILAHILLRSDPPVTRTGHIVERVSDIRASGEGKAHREWYTKLRTDLGNGVRPDQVVNDIKKVTSEVEQVLRGAYPKWSVKVDPSLAIGPSLSLAAGYGGAELKVEAKIAEVKVEATPFRIGIPDWVRNWMLDVLPFGRHRKLLLRSALAQASYHDITLNLRRVWYAS